MNPDGRRIGVAGLAAVLPGVRGLRRLNEKPGGGDVATLLGYHGDAAPGTVVAQDVLIVVPEDVGWWLRAEAYGARQVYRAASTDVQLGAAQYRRRRYNDVQAKLIRLDRYGGNLTFVDSLVALLRPFYAESPLGPFVAVARILSVQRLKSLIARVRVRSRRQDVDVPVPDPGYGLVA